MMALSHVRYNKCHIAFITVYTDSKDEHKEAGSPADPDRPADQDFTLLVNCQMKCKFAEVIAIKGAERISLFFCNYAWILAAADVYKDIERKTKRAAAPVQHH